MLQKGLRRLKRLIDLPVVVGRRNEVHEEAKT